MSAKHAKKFDAYAESYEQLHAKNVALTGEETGYFSQYKVECLLRAGVNPAAPLLDFGCGIGNMLEKLVGSFSVVHGFEPSELSADKARERVPGAQVHHDVSDIPKGAFEAVVLACVLHHVPVAERASVMQQAMTALVPGGRLFIFEHNPWNPLTRRAVSTCEFDDDAILLWPGEQRRLLRDAGFEKVKLDYIVFFPAAVSFLRPLEPRLRWLFAGAQTMTYGRKPGG
ncbi:MAG: class SAM-dependent methyltransferase [Polyangiaceae bacterium]|jgi:SAM-dependent methyltransferase|nr:class SAM-dependent methyltransferase [Polyangiaceae bacterium]